MRFLPPANEVCEGNVFTGVCLSMDGGSLSRSDLCPGRSLSIRVSVQGISVWGISVRETPVR